MELSRITAESPYFPVLVALFAVSFVGILFVLLSKNAQLKRLVLPATLVVFHLDVFLMLLVDGRFGRSPAVLATIVAALLANSAYVVYAIRFCAQCGATTQRLEGPPWRCAECRARTP